MHRDVINFGLVLTLIGAHEDLMSVLVSVGFTPKPPGNSGVVKVGLSGLAWIYI